MATNRDARRAPGSDGTTGELAGSRVAILAETLYEDLELWYPYYRLREAGADVFVVGSGSAETYQSKHGYPVTADANWVDREVVRDGNLITSRSPADLPAFMRTVVAALRERRGQPSTPEREVALAG